MQTRIITPNEPTPGETLCSSVDIPYTAFCPCMVLVYREKLDPERLARAMEAVLGDFPVLTGKLKFVRNRLVIKHSPARALLETDTTALSLRELVALAQADKSHPLWPKLSPVRQIFLGQALLALRLTTGPDGCMLAIRFSHAAVDLSSVYVFVRALSFAYQGRPHPKPLMILDRDAYLRERVPDPPESRPGLERLSWREAFRNAYASTRKKARADFAFSHRQVELLHERAAGPSFVSANDALVAHMFLTLRKVRGPLPPANLCLTVNYRQRIGLPETMLGNALALVSQGVCDGDRLHDTAAGLRARLGEFKSRGIDYHATKRVIDANSSVFSRVRLCSEHFRPARGDFMVANWTKFGIYDLAFESSGPELFWGWSEIPPSVGCIYDLPDGSGVGFGVYLVPSQLSRLTSEEGRALLYPGDSRSVSDAHPEPIHFSQP